MAEVITAKELAERLGVSLPTIYRYVARGVLPARKRTLRGVVFVWSECRAALERVGWDETLYHSEKS